MRLYKPLLFLVPLIIGGFIYVIFRSEKLLMFDWFQTLHLQNQIRLLRDLNCDHSTPNWLKYNLPDGLWIFSYVLISFHIWKYKITLQNFFWVFIIPIIAIFSEFLQALEIIPGTFDFLDLLFYTIGIFLPFFFYQKKLTINILKL